MAIAIERRIGISSQKVETAQAKTVVKEQPLSPVELSKEEVNELLKLYWRNRLHVHGLVFKDMSPAKAEEFGVLEIQGLVLRMLGVDPINLEVSGSKTIAEKDLGVLRKRYEAAYKVYIEKDIEERTWEEGINPEEARILGNMDELKVILKRLGQTDFIESVESRIENGSRPVELINWDKMRSTTNGELQ